MILEKTMLNRLWGYLLLFGIGFGIISGQVTAISNTLIDSAQDAVTLAITMLGIMSMWMGFIQIARRSGLMEQLTILLQPIISFLFPHIPKKHPCIDDITGNIVANVLGLGWAATPMGLKAMKGLANLQRERLASQNKSTDFDYATDEMCTFLIINISSLQIIPINVIAYRSQYGSKTPADIVLPGLLATLISTLTAVIFCRLMARFSDQ